MGYDPRWIWAKSENLSLVVWDEWIALEWVSASGTLRYGGFPGAEGKYLNGWYHLVLLAVAAHILSPNLYSSSPPSVLGSVHRKFFF